MGNFEHTNKPAPAVVIQPDFPDPILITRTRIRRQNRINRTKTFVFITIGFFIVSFLLYNAFRDFSFGLPVFEDEKVSNAEKRKMVEEEYLFFLNDGDKWLTKHHYHNAIFQYKKALELLPFEYAANYRLALAYTYRCQNKFTDCEEGKALVDKLKKQFPENGDIKELASIYDHWAVQ